MKILLVLALALTSSVALAARGEPRQTDSWDAIRANNNRGTISQGAYASSFGPEGFFNACVDGSLLRSIKPVSICAEFETINDGEGGSHQECVRYVGQNVSLSLNQTTERCVQWSNGGNGESYNGPVCERYEAVRVRISTTQQFGVYVWTSTGGEMGPEMKLAFTKPYTIAACGRGGYDGK